MRVTLHSELHSMSHNIVLLNPLGWGLSLHSGGLGLTRGGCGSKLDCWVRPDGREPSQDWQERGLPLRDKRKTKSNGHRLLRRRLAPFCVLHINFGGDSRRTPQPLLAGAREDPGGLVSKIPG